MKIPS